MSKTAAADVTGLTVELPLNWNPYLHYPEVYHKQS